jgi:hypothetical protein
VRPVPRVRPPWRHTNGWHDDGTTRGTQGTRSIWFDEIGAGTTFAHADPDPW